MDYYVSSVESMIRIKKENYDKVTEILSEYDSRHGDGFFAPAGWMNESEANLCRAFLKLGWLLEFNTSKETSQLVFVDDQLSAEDRWLMDIAPLVEQGSYIDMVGEDTAHWRWFFNGHGIDKFLGFVVYPGCPDTIPNLGEMTMSELEVCGGNCEGCKAHHYEPGTTDYEETEDMIIPLF